MFSWMVWTTPVAVFFSAIVLMLIVMTVWEIKSPTTLRKGWLPIANHAGGPAVYRLIERRLFEPCLGWTPGEKMINWFELNQEPSVWIGFMLSMVLLVVIMRKG